MKVVEMAFFTDDVAGYAEEMQQLLCAAPRHLGPDIAVFEQDGIKTLIHATYEPGPDEPPCENHTAFATREMEADIRLLEANGCKLVLPPRNYDWGRSAYLRGQDGALFELILETG